MELLQDTEKLIGELEFVSDGLGRYFELTKKEITRRFGVPNVAAESSEEAEE